jgi:DNA invertase Pin-like site-specific DNA recombinase
MSGLSAVRYRYRLLKQMKADGMGPSTIAKALKIGRASVYRALIS